MIVPFGFFADPCRQQASAGGPKYETVLDRPWTEDRRQVSIKVCIFKRDGLSAPMISCSTDAQGGHDFSEGGWFPRLTPAL